MSFSDTLKGLIFKNPAPGYQSEPTVEKEEKQGKRQEETENPYLTARRTWNEHVGSVVSAKQTWQVVGILSLLITLAAVGGVIHIGSQSKFVPYVVEVDSLGQAQAAGPVTASSMADPRVMGSTVSKFIENARLVSPDVALQRKAVFGVYAHLSPKDSATIKMNEWLNGSADSSPFKRAAKVMVSIDIKSVMPQTPTTWQVDWVETVRDRQGVKQGEPALMRALVTVYTADTSTQTTEEQMRNNPLGIYVRDFSWSRLQ
ncbi:MULTISPECIES: conjugal transfer protein TrbF [Pseudomonadota]|jgi:type IV secretion system protein VirB5|uniref:TrbF protein n=3 Tax=Pseudomonadota TaxID=1224 RepID=C5NNE1_PHODP|nr:MULTISPECIES: conjugal transfer protein TrbF [Pseudomonadota]HCH1007485.1 conjugal transfer protein TrbF [Vibrio parahaemolyticus]AXQ85537.1 Conjugative transfer protein TrbF [Vibrio alginolyticus]MBU2867852.1 conjugal transfer protein TrbF [Pacificibacter marinus]MBU2956031.1 conjugal transfer protein TrbF [Marinobacter sp. F3R08]MDW1593733.1 conjugal transfer protein TrbF [Vibrio sp. Vb2944]